MLLPVPRWSKRTTLKLFTANLIHPDASEGRGDSNPGPPACVRTRRRQLTRGSREPKPCGLLAAFRPVGCVLKPLRCAVVGARKGVADLVGREGKVCSWRSWARTALGRTGLSPLQSARAGEGQKYELPAVRGQQGVSGGPARTHLAAVVQGNAEDQVLHYEAGDLELGVLSVQVPAGARKTQRLLGARGPWVDRARATRRHSASRGPLLSCPSVKRRLLTTLCSACQKMPRALCPQRGAFSCPGELSF